MKQVTPNKNLHIDLGDINRRAKNPQKFIADCENDYHEQLELLVHTVSSEGYRVVMLAGPSSSGKTTTANKLSQCFKERGIHAPVVSLDDFFLGIAFYPKLPDGSPDMEAVEALDLPCINKTFADLLEKGEALFPTFDFQSSSRCQEQNLVTLGDHGVLIVEGLHALNPRLTESLDSKSLFKAYVSTRTQYMYGDVVALTPKDNRLIRRLVRDHNFRGKSPFNTLLQWEDVLDGEDKYIYPFRDSADFKIDSSLDYEGCVFHHYILPMCHDLKDGNLYSGKIRQVLEILEAFDDIDYEFIPDDSLLREFIGNSATPLIFSAPHV